MTAVKTEPASFYKIDAEECLCCGSLSLDHKSDYPSDVDKFRDLDVYYCTNCGVGYVKNSKLFLDNYYKIDYANINRGDREFSPEVYFSDDFRQKSRKIQRYFVRASRHIDLLRSFNVPMGCILDYGSGPGYLLHLSEAFEKIAYEPDTKSKKYLDYLGARIVSDIGELSPSSLDGVVSSHSLEHLPIEELNTTIEKILTALKPGGRFLIEVPQGGHSYLHLDTRQDPHTIFFTPESLCLAVERAKGRILYRKAFAKTEAPTRKNPLYVPSNNFFNKECRGGLTIVCEKAVGE